jgi:serine protease Do
MRRLSQIKLNAVAMTASVTLAAAASFFCAVPASAAAPAVNTAAVSGLPDLTYAAENTVNSVVYIKVTVSSKVQQVQTFPFDDFFGDFFGFGNGQREQQQPQVRKSRASGSGVIISSDGYIVTNNHVVADADEIDVKLNDNREFKARIIGTDKTTDLALIKIEAKGLKAIPIGDSEKLKIGEWVLAVGNPFNLTSTVTAGIVSAKARSLTGSGVESFIQTDAAINPGNSGGALVNSKGELVGINAMLYSNTGSFSGYGFAIPTTIMNKVVADLKQYGTVQRAVLGITGGDVTNYIDQQRDKGKDVDLGTDEGIYVDEVSDESAASEAELQKGDVITAINGKKVTKIGELQEAISQYHPGDKVTITYLRNKKSYTKTVVLKNMQGTTDKLSEVDPNSLGVVLKPLTADMKRDLALSYGLYISSITNGKMKDAGATKGLIIMMVNDKKMNTVDDFNEAVKAANMTKERVLWIRAKTQSGLNRSLAVELGDSKDSKNSSSK